MSLSEWNFWRSDQTHCISSSLKTVMCCKEFAGYYLVIYRGHRVHGLFWIFQKISIECRNSSLVYYTIGSPLCISFHVSSCFLPSYASYYIINNSHLKCMPASSQAGTLNINFQKELAKFGSAGWNSDSSCVIAHSLSYHD